MDSYFTNCTEEEFFFLKPPPSRVKITKYFNEHSVAVNASQSNTVLYSGILALDFGPGYWNPDVLLVEFRFRIAIVNGITDSLNCILHSAGFQISPAKISQLPEPLLWGEKGKAHTATRQQFLFYQDLTRMMLYNILHSNGNTLMGFWHDCLLHSRHVHAWVHMALVSVYMTHVPVSLERSHSRNSCTQFATQSSASVFHTWNTREGREFFRFVNVIIHIQN